MESLITGKGVGIFFQKPLRVYPTVFPLHRQARPHIPSQSFGAHEALRLRRHTCLLLSLIALHVFAPGRRKTRAQCASSSCRSLPYQHFCAKAIQKPVASSSRPRYWPTIIETFCMASTPKGDALVGGFPTAQWSAAKVAAVHLLVQSITSSPAAIRFPCRPGPLFPTVPPVPHRHEFSCPSTSAEFPCLGAFNGHRGLGIPVILCRSSFIVPP
jgi:hypothetical protein